MVENPKVNNFASSSPDLNSPGRDLQQEKNDGGANEQPTAYCRELRQEDSRGVECYDFTAYSNFNPNPSSLSLLKIIEIIDNLNSPGRDLQQGKNDGGANEQPTENWWELLQEDSELKKIIIIKKDKI